MGELRRYIKSNNLIMRVVSLLLSVTVLASALVYFSDENIDSVSAETTVQNQEYMKYIVQRLIDGAQEEFNILEIVPYKGQGELRYYASDDEVEEGLEARQDYLETLYKATGKTKNNGKWNVENEWVDVKTPFTNFKYKIMYNSATQKFEVQAPDTFAKEVTPQYQQLISEKINVNTVEANKITTADIQKADLIIISKGSHDNSTIAAYREFSNDREQTVYGKTVDKDGKVTYNLLKDTDSITYNTYEKVEVKDEPVEDDPVIEITTGKIYFENADGWSNVYAYYWNDNNDEMVSWPGKKMELAEGETNVYVTEITSDVQYIMFTNASASNSPQLSFPGFEKAYSNGAWVNYPIVKDDTQNPDSGNTDSGNTDSGNTDSGNTDSGNTDSGNTDSGNTDSGSTVEGYKYVTRDMSWNMCEQLLDYMINGKTMELPDGTTLTGVRTPVIIDNACINGLNQDSNIYKMLLIYRLCDADRWNVLKEYISTTDVNNNKYINASGDVTVAMDVDGKGFTDTALTSWTVGEKNTVKTLFDRIAPNNKLGNVELSTLKETNPFMADHLTNYYWVYSGSSVIIPSTVKNEIPVSGKEFSDRIGNGKTAVDVMRYLLGCKSNQVYSFSDKVRVLEIQPCNCFQYTSLKSIQTLGQILLRTDAANWTDGGEKDYRKYISIDHVTPNALNGMTVDIASEYDLVIIGDYIGKSTDANGLTRDSNGKTIYNDRNLNGYVYLAFGDLMKISSYALGYLPDEYMEVSSSTSGVKNVSEANRKVWTPYLYSTLGLGKYYVVKDMRDYYVGKSNVKKNKNKKIDNESFYLDHALGNTRISDNDITDITREKLEAYVKTGNPIIVADSIYNADKTVLYPTSDMYYFAKNTLGATDSNGNRKNKNVLSLDAMGTAVAYLGTKAPKITFNQGLIEYIERTVDAKGKEKYTVYKIFDESNRDEYAALGYKETKKVADIKPIVPDYIGDDKETGTGGVISTFSSRTLRFDFNITGQVGKTYRVKLLVDKNNDGVYEDVGSGALDENNEVYYSKDVKLTSRTMNYKINAGLAESFIGMLAWRLEVIQLDEEGKQTPYKVTETDYSAIRNEKIRKLKVLQIAPEKQSKGNYLELNTGSFSTLMNAVESVVGYDMEVTLISTSDFVAKYTSKNKYTKGNIGVEGVDRLYDYNMVVLGFKDSYGGRDINNNYGALDNILDYMDAGKAVLFTHDTVSWRSTPNYKSGYYDSSNKLKILSPGSIYDIKVDGKTGSQTQYGDTCFNLTINFRNRVGMDKYGVTLTAAERAAQGKEVPMYAPSSDTDTQYRPSYMKTDVVREIQGFNNWNTGRMNFCFNVSNGYIENKNSNNYYWSAPYVDNSYDNSDSGSVMYKTKKVVQLNKGPITMYPYNVGVNVDIAETHGQYFELDMEDEDIVVWYTLDAGSSYYTRTYKDAGNNYYIYSKNNITYSGAGHENMGGSSLELKLFVNTIVKAIAGGNSAPVITVTNGGETVNDYVVYVSSSDKADEYEIDFKADDADLVSLETTGGDISLVGEFKKAEVFYWDKDLDKWDSIKVYQAEKDANGKKIKSGLKNGIIQELRLKDTSLTAEQKNKIQAAVQADEGPRFKIVVEDSAGISDTVFITLKVRDLFELD